MSTAKALIDLETLFIEKLQEKYKLNKRDLKKAFNKFDSDNNGLLDLDELTKGIKLFLNGVKENQVAALVSKYDINGDGKISYDEFLHFLTSRTAISEDDDNEDDDNVNNYVNSIKLQKQAEQVGGYRRDIDISSENNYNNYTESSYSESQETEGDTNSIPSDGNINNYKELGGGTKPVITSKQPLRNNYMQHHNRNNNDQDSVISSKPSEINISNPKEFEYRTKIFLDNLKAYLLKQATQLRMSSKLTQASLVLKASEYHESTARAMIMKAFQPYTGQGEGKAREYVQGVEPTDFAKVLRSYRFPGVAPIRPETIQYIFDLCAPQSKNTANGADDTKQPVADCNILADLLFGIPTSVQDRKARGMNLVSYQHLDANTEDMKGRNVKGYVAQIERDRDIVGKGPVKLVTAADAQKERAMEILTVPLRFISKKSRTALNVPSNFDAVANIAKSNQLPGYDLVRKHVFGMSGSSYSGNTLYSLPSTPTAFNSSSNNGGISVANCNNPDFIDNATIVYAAASLGIVHNLAENKQLFFDAHDDDITCITISQDGIYAATGQMGKSPMVYIWLTNIPSSQSKKPINKIGGGFFARGVCALAFSFENTYLICIGCDDNHIMGIFDTSTCQKVAEAPCQHGIPPQIKWIQYCPSVQHTEYITKEHPGLCDLFATSGANHMRIWSFKRPSSANAKDSSLVYKAATIGKANISAPKSYLCCGFIYCEDKTYDLVAGGSNGIVYLWRKAIIIATSQVFKGKVQCLVVSGDRVYCGGSPGAVKILDARTLGTIQQFHLIQSMDASISKKGNLNARGSGPSVMKSNSSINRPRSASATPGSRLQHRPQGIKIRPALDAPKHAAGGGSASKTQDDSAGAVIGGAGMRGAATDKDDDDNAYNDGAGSKVVTGIAIVKGLGRTSAQATYILAALGNGKLMRVECGSAIIGASNLTPRPSSAAAATAANNMAVVNEARGKELFHFHTGPVYGLAADTTQENRLFATVCDDRKLIVWDAQDCVMIGKATIQSPSRCCHIDNTSSFIAVGSTAGTLTVYYLSNQMSSRNHHYRITEVAFRKDSQTEATEVKFSPSNDKIALGCRDDCIYLYDCELGSVQIGQGRNTIEKGMCVLRALHKLRGHSSTISHFDWSFDSKLLRSACNAYELLCWDIETGRLSATTNVADIKWKTNHCILGFSVMGIWPPYSDGTDINAIDVLTRKGIVASANDDHGLVKLFNYPCVVRNAPGKEYTGHSSHVTNLKFMRDGDYMITTGGNDRSVVVWHVARDESIIDANGFH